jgi:hypothetical protein
MLVLFWSVGEPPAKAQSQDSLSSTQEAQSPDGERVEQLKKKAEELMGWFDKREFAKARETLHPDLQPYWPVEKIEQAWDDLVAETGALQQVTSSKVIQTITSDLVLVILKFEKGTKDLLVTFNKEEQIVGIDVPRPESIEEIAEKFVDDLGAQDFVKVRGYMHPYLKEAILPEQIQQKWEELQTVTGRFQRRLGSKVMKGSDIDNADLVLVTIEFEKVTDELIVTFDRDKKIIGVNFPEVKGGL